MQVDSLFDPIIARLSKVMDLRTEQHDMYAANLANAATPHYKSKEYDFSQVLMEVMNIEGDNLSMSNTSFNHLGGLSGLNAQAKIKVQEAPPWSLDGNSVNVEEQLTKTMENHLLYGTLARVTSKRLSLLKLAVMGGRF